MATESALSPALVEQVMKLPPADQDELIDLILDARDGPPPDPPAVAAAWKAELGTRIESYLRGEVKGLDAGESANRIRAKLREEFGHDG